MQKYSSQTSLNDLLFNMLLLFIFLFTIAFLMISPEEDKNKAQIISKAEFIITSEWLPILDDDVDIYIEDPLGNLIWFGCREKGLISLDRDDLGHLNDMIETVGGPIFYDENKETITVRQIVEGEYIVNTHLYAHRSTKDVEVTIQLIKLNPYSVVTIKKVVLSQNGDEKTAFRFVLNKDGRVTETNELEKRLANQKSPNPNMDL